MKLIELQIKIICQTLLTKIESAICVKTEILKLYLDSV